LKHKKAAFVSFRALVYLTTLEFLVLKSSSNHVFLLKLHLTKYIHTHTCTSERERKATQTNPLGKLNYPSAFFCFVFKLLFLSFLWNASASARGTLNRLPQLCAAGTLRDSFPKGKGVVLMQIGRSCYCFGFMETLWKCSKVFWRTITS